MFASLRTIIAAALALTATSIEPLAPGRVVTATLEEADSTFDSDGSHYDLYTYTGVAGERLVIEMGSEEFDSYLIVAMRTPDGELHAVAENDDADQTTLDARVEFTLPADGEYIVVANGLNADDLGEYAIRLQSTRPASRRATRPARRQSRPWA